MPIWFYFEDDFVGRDMDFRLFHYPQHGNGKRQDFVIIYISDFAVADSRHGLLVGLEVWENCWRQF